MPKKISAKTASGTRGLKSRPMMSRPLPPPPLQVQAPVATQIETQIMPLTLIVCSLALLAAFGSSMMAGIVNMASAFTADQYFLVKEAEHFSNQGQASKKDDGDGFYVLMNGSDGVADLSTKITLTNITLKTGQYNLWVKVIADATNRDSFMYKLPGQQNFLQHTIPTTQHSPTWQWRKIPFSFTATATTNNDLSLAWRETKQFDKVIITNNLSFVPYSGKLLVGYWRFNDHASYTDKYYVDYSGFGNDAANIGEVYCETHYGISGNSCSFGKINQYLNINKVDNFFNPQGGTVSAWVNPSEKRNNSYVLQGVGKNSNRYYVQWNNGGFRVVRGSDAAVVTLASNVQLNNWYHVAISWTENEVLGYFNGQLVGSAKYVVSGAPASDTAYKDAPRFRIGNQSATDNRSFPGLIDEVRFYGEKLSNNDIGLIYNNEKSKSCFDSETLVAGDPFVNGTIRGFIGDVYKVTEDVCATDDSYTLAEYSCSQIGQIKQELVKCANGCSNGACNRTPVCTDSDLSSTQTFPYISGNSDPYVKGVSTGLTIHGDGTVGTVPETSSDVCYGFGWLSEYYCNSDGFVTNTGITCDSGCVDGACVNPNAVLISMFVNQSYGASTFTSPSSQAKIGSFIITAANNEAVNVNNIFIGGAYPSLLSNLNLKVGSTIIGTIATLPATNNVSSTVFVGGKLNVAEGETKIVDIYADIASGLDSQIFRLLVNANGVTANSGLVAQGTDRVLQAIIIDNGSLVIDANGSKPDSTIVVAGATTAVSAFTMLAVNDSFTITDLTVSSALYNSNQDRSISAVILEYYNETGIKKTATGYLSGGRAMFNNLRIWVPENRGATVTIKAMIANAAGAKSGDLIRLGLAPSDGTASTFSAVNNSTGKSTYNYTGASGVIGNPMVVRKTKPTVFLISLPTSVLADGTQTISNFSVSADSAGDVSWKKVNLNYAASAGLTISNCSLYKDGNYTGLGMGVKTETGISFVLSSEQTITKGSLQKYVVKCDINGSSANSYLSTRLSGTSASAGTTNTYDNLNNSGEKMFAWSDRSGLNNDGVHTATSDDWCDSNYVRSLPTDSQNLSR